MVLPVDRGMQTLTLFHGSACWFIVLPVDRDMQTLTLFLCSACWQRCKTLTLFHCSTCWQRCAECQPWPGTAGRTCSAGITTPATASVDSLSTAAAAATATTSRRSKTASTTANETVRSPFVTSVSVRHNGNNRPWSGCSDSVCF